MGRLKHLIVEAHRRSLWQVLGIYAVASWVVYQVILALTDGLGLPEWVPGMAIVLILLGLPIVLATAFVQEGLQTRDRPAERAWQQPDVDPTLFPDASHLATAGASARSEAAEPSTLGRSLTWRRSLVGGVLAFALLGFGAIGWIGMRALGIGPWGSLVAAGVLDPSTRIVIADFDPRGADTTLAGVVTEAFRIDFARSTLVRPAEPTAIREVLRRMQRSDVTRLDPELAREVALRAGISAYITGELTAAGTGFVLTARLLATESGEVIAAFREQARDADDVINAIDRLSRSLRERTGESLTAIRRSQPLEQVTTSSLEALQKYTQAIRASLWEGDTPRGTRLLREAVELDTAFAAAYRALAISFSNSNQPERALALMERALRHEDRLSDFEREVTYGSFHSVRNERAEAIAAYERAIRINPQTTTALNNIALVYEELYDYERAENYMRRSVQADTSRYFGYTNLGELLTFRGRFDEAEQAFRNAVARAPESAWAAVNVALVRNAAGDHDEAETRLRQLIDDPAASRVIRDRADNRLWHLLLLRGRLAEAERHVEAAARRNGDAAEVELQLGSHRFDVTAAIRRDSVRARGMLREGLALIGDDVDTTTSIQVAAACAEVGDLPCARDFLRRAGFDGPPQPWTNFTVYVAQAWMAVGERDYPRAIRLFRGIQDRRCPRCEESAVGHAFELMQQPDSAIAAYERYLAAPSVDRIFADAFDLAYVLERLGALYEQRNDRANAAKHYARLVDLWKNADAELQPRIAEARRRLSVLQPDR